MNIHAYKLANIHINIHTHTPLTRTSSTAHASILKKEGVEKGEEEEQGKVVGRKLRREKKGEKALPVNCGERLL